MWKGLFLSLPSESINSSLVPVMNGLANNGYEIIWYNNHALKGNNSFKFKTYPAFDSGYDSPWIHSDSSYYRLTEVLMDTTIHLMDFLIAEVEREQPDFIIYPHLSIWAKLIARYFKLPAIMCSTTFVMDQRIMIPYFRKFRTATGAGTEKVDQAFNFLSKAKQLYKRLNITERVDIWDAYINSGNLNLVLIPEEFQPDINLLDESYKFIGFPTILPAKTSERKLVYVSLGTILNVDTAFYNICIQAISSLQLEGIISLGKSLKKESLDPVGNEITLAESVDQNATLLEAAVFVTSGGMASVSEAVAAKTPMIVIPQTTEQKITAERIADLGLGVHLDRSALTMPNLSERILQLMNDPSYKEKITALSDEMSAMQVTDKTIKLISTYLDKELKLNHT
ncbi:hypothetical protein DBR43_30290 [Pedobacter sp. KBW06]|uniref:nucleotide disphospho-sugar-binding domain-containing protein n=1 Tax=Pedobacter sp. KBW06 TaxID=2153359 RepID=UPI000F5B2717|nr:nucleotide disphospho-sugar-binding domain-containing protein [Pedobacter sp. KBW06]RQO65149.1 hypothetical protein DBR43_30290 [Pedobacter sp. KBW06]